MPPMTPKLGSAPSRPTALLVLTCLGALDGTVMLLAATGRLHTLGGALVVGLTVISGVGAWITAREVFSGPLGRREAGILAGMASLSIAATVLAAWIGASLGAATLHVLPKAAGVVLFLVAAEVGGLHLPQPAHVPLPVIAVAAGLLLEGYWQWSP